MINENFQIQEWARMLDDAMADETQIDERRMEGPAAAARGGVDEIAEFRQMLDDGVVEFQFRKADGTLRHAIGTTSEDVVAEAERRRLDPDYDANVESYERRSAYIIWFWDLEKNECRCFNTNRFEGLVRFERTNRHVDNSVSRIGDIFIHRDVDAGMEGQGGMTPERANRISDEIRNELRTGGAIAAAFGGCGFGGADIGSVGIEVGPGGEPVLKIVIRKRGTDDDRPYQLRVNDLRRAVLNQYGVDVKRVVVDGEFQF